MSRNPAAQHLRGIYAILDADATPDVPAFAEALLRGGIRLFQYRAKRGADLAHVRTLRAQTRARHALMIVNDDLQLALDSDADGLHVGPEDASTDELPAIRRALSEKLLGISCGTPQEARSVSAHADYLGVGSVYATQSKTDAGAPIGIAGLRAVVQASAVPVAAVGGITLAKVRAVRASGAAMAAAISPFAEAADPVRIAREFVSRWNA